MLFSVGGLQLKKIPSSNYHATQTETFCNTLFLKTFTAYNQCEYELTDKTNSSFTKHNVYYNTYRKFSTGNSLLENKPSEPHTSKVLDGVSGSAETAESEILPDAQSSTNFETSPNNTTPESPAFTSKSSAAARLKDAVIKKGMLL